MKKKTFLLFLFAILALSISASPIDKAQALEIAKAFFGVRGYSSMNQLSMAYSPKVNTIGTITKKSNPTVSSLYYVINRGNDNGYIVVAGDDRVTNILAYSETGKLTEEDIENHPSIKWMFDEYKKQMAWILENVPDTPLQITRAGKPQTLIEPLLEYATDRQTKLPQAISWGQAWPFNLYAPNYNYKGRTYPTVSGCVATAMSTVMRWHKWPNRPKGYTQYYWKNRYPLNQNFDKSKDYDWNQMPAAVTSGGYDRETGLMLNETQADNIGRLLRDVGYAMKMDYNPAFTGGSGAYVYNAPDALVKHFGYKDKLRFLERDRFRINDWMQNIRSEMEDYGPVVYAGFSRGGGHCFVLDGFATEGYVHVDWGWNRSENGWYLLNILKPGQEGIGGGGGGYSSNQQMLRYLEPDRPNNPEPKPKPKPEPQPEEKKPILYIYGNKKDYKAKVGDRITVTVSVGNKGNDSYVGSVALSIYKTENDNHSVILDDMTTIIGSGYYRTFNFTVKTDELSAGKYFFAVNYKKNGEYKAIQDYAATLTLVENSPKPKPEPRPEPKPEPRPIVKDLKMIVPYRTFSYAYENENIKIPVTIINKGDNNYKGTVKLYALPENAQSYSEKVLISEGNTSVNKWEYVNYTFYTNDAFKELKNTTGDKYGTKYYLLIAFTQNGKEYLGRLDYQNEDNRIGELRIKSVRNKPNPTPSVRKGDVALKSARFYQEGKLIGSDNSLVLSQLKELTIRYYLKSEYGYSGKVNFYVTSISGSSIPTTTDRKLLVTKQVKINAGDEGYVDITFPISKLRAGFSFANIQYEVTGTQQYYYRKTDEVSFYVRTWKYYDYVEPVIDDNFPKGDPYRLTKGQTYEFGIAPQAYYTVQSIGIDINDNNHTVDGITKNEYNNTFKVSPKVVKEDVNITVPKDCNVSIYSLNGQKVMSQEINSGINKINIENLSSGMYIVKTIYGVTKIIKE